MRLSRGSVASLGHNGVSSAESSEAAPDGAISVVEVVAAARRLQGAILLTVVLGGMIDKISN